jgi:hypothetical protein
MIERGKAPREQIRRLVSEIDRHAEAQMLRSRHRGHEQRGIVDGQLNRLAQRDVDIALIDVVHADDIGEKQPSNRPRSSVRARSVQYASWR